jgi:flagellin-like hook-associated protein FlgL
MLKDTISSLLNQNLVMKDIYESIFNALDKYMEETGADSPLESDIVAFDRDNVSLKILNLNDIDLSTLEKAAEAVERVNAALERVASYAAGEGDEDEQIKANAPSDSLAPLDSLNGNLALNAAFRSVFGSLELLAKETAQKNESGDDEEAGGDDAEDDSGFWANLYENAREGLAAAHEADDTVLSALRSLSDVHALKGYWEFGEKPWLSGAQFIPGNKFYIQSGPNEGDGTTLDLGFVSFARGMWEVDLSDRESASGSVAVLDKALEAVNAQRAMVGAQINGMEHRIDYLESSAAIAESAYSRIMDADIAKEMLTYVKLSLSNQINSMLLKQVADMRQRTLNLLM